MNMTILEVMCCPVCKGRLSVKEDTEEFCA